MELKLLLIGIGNEFRGDDGAGLTVARGVMELHLPGIRVVETSDDGTLLMEIWKGAETVILVDAVSSGAKTGTIFRLDAGSEPLPARFFHPSTHAFGVAQAIELSRSLHQLPQHLIFYGIEAKTFTSGACLSPEVRQAIPEVVDMLYRDVAMLSTRVASHE